MVISEENDRVVILAPLSAISKRLRLLKIANFIKSKYTISILHIGWERSKGEQGEERLSYPIDKRIILEGGGYSSKKVKLMYFLWIIKSFIHCLTLKKTDVVWALGFESAFPAFLASHFKGYKVIFDDADRFSLVFNFPSVINKLIQHFEKITSRGVEAHIIPGIERYDFVSDKFYMIKNVPSEVELEKAKLLFENRDWPEADLVININGWLHETRGLDVALFLSRELKEHNIHFILAGRLASREAEELKDEENVTYLGNITNAEALASYLASDFVLTYFKPVSVINTLAESNKWGDAIKLGVGIIVNSEVLTANYLKEGGACISFPYNEKEKVREKLLFLLKYPGQIKLIKENSENLSTVHGFFEEQLEDLFNSVRNRNKC